MVCFNEDVVHLIGTLDCRAVCVDVMVISKVVWCGCVV